MPRDQRSGRERSKVRSRRWLTTFVVRGIELAEHLAIRREQVCVPADGVEAGWRLARPAGYLWVVPPEPELRGLVPAYAS